MDGLPKVTKDLCISTPDGGMVCRPPEDVFCSPPAVYTCAPSALTLCHCVVPPPVLTCTATISFPVDSPSTPTVVTDAACVNANLELALTLILARILGAP